MSYPKTQTSSLVKVKEKFQVTIPNNIRRIANIKVGDIFETLIQNNKTIILKPKILVDKKNKAKDIAEGMHDYKTGKVAGPFNNVKEFKSFIRKS